MAIVETQLNNLPAVAVEYDYGASEVRFEEDQRLTKTVQSGLSVKTGFNASLGTYTETSFEVNESGDVTADGTFTLTSNNTADISGDLQIRNSSSGDLFSLDDGNTPQLAAQYEGSGAFTFGYRTGNAGSESVVFSGTGSSPNEASGARSAAFGEGNTVSVFAGFAAGSGNTINGAGANAVFGINNTVSGGSAFAYGNQSTASGDNSIAGGQFSTASGGETVALGTATANNTSAVAIGSNDVTASGINSLALGTGGSATARDAVKLGDFANANAEESIAIGGFSTADGYGSAAIGPRTRTVATGSAVVGIDNEEYTTAQSNFNEPGNSDRLFATGVGDTNFSNSRGSVDGLYVTYRNGTFARHGLQVDGYDGSSYVERFSVSGSGVITTTQNTADVSGDLQIRDDSTGDLFSLDDGNSPPVSARYEGTGAFTFGHRNTSNGTGDNSTVLSGNEFSGETNEASGFASLATGIGTTASATASTAMGNGTTASGTDATAMGDGTTASGNQSTAMGFSTTASGGNSTAMGSSTIASDAQSVAMGNSTEANGASTVAMGDSTTAGPAQFAVAMGTGTTASGNASFATGDSTTASGAQSTATGNSTEASGNSATAMGNTTVASAPDTSALNNNTVSRVQGNLSSGNYNEDYTSGTDVNSISSLSSSDRILAVGVGDNPSATSGDTDFFDGRGRVDGLYVEYRNGTFVRHGLQVDGYNASLGQYERRSELLKNGGLELTGGILRGSRNNVATNTSTTATDYFIGINTSAGEFTVTLSTSDATDGREIVIHDQAGDADLNPITVDTEGSAVITGPNSGVDQSSVQIDQPAESITLRSDGTDWYIV